MLIYLYPGIIVQQHVFHTEVRTNRSLTPCKQIQRAHEQGTGYYASIAKLLSRDDGNDYGFS